MGDNGFSMAEFTTAVNDIERYLGWLKGNEVLHDWIQALLADPTMREPTTTDDGALYPLVFSTSPSEGQYSVRFAREKLLHAPAGHHDDYHRAAEQTWSSGASWSSGIGDYLISMVTDVTTPEASALESSVVDLKQAGDEIAGLLEAGWTNLDVNSWDGLSSDAFQTTISTFNDYLRDQYLAYWRHSETVYAAACAIVVQIQGGLLPYVRQVRQQLQDQLLGWAAASGPPGDLKELPSKVVDALTLGKDVVSLVPAVGDVLGKAEKIADTTSRLVGLFSEPPPTVPDDLVPTTSDAIYISVTTGMADNFARGMTDALNKLQADRATVALNAQQDMNPWLMPTFADAADEPWKHAKER